MSTCLMLQLLISFINVQLLYDRKKLLLQQSQFTVTYLLTSTIIVQLLIMVELKVYLFFSKDVIGNYLQLVIRLIKLKGTILYDTMFVLAHLATSPTLYLDTSP